MEIKKGTILFAEDDKFIARALKDGLSEVGYTVHNAFTGEEAISILKEKKPDLVVLDIVMPGKDGIEVLREMNDNKKYQKIPVIIFSNVDVEDQVSKFANIEVVEYLLKANFTMNQVITIINKYID